MNESPSASCKHHIPIGEDCRACAAESEETKLNTKKTLSPHSPAGQQLRKYDIANGIKR